MSKPVPLVVVASEKEAVGLVPQLGLQRDLSFDFPLRERESNIGFYRGTSCNLAITGVLEHNMVAQIALVLSRLTEKVPFVLNFGTVGYYRQKGKTQEMTLGDSVLVNTVRRFDIDDNLHWAPPINLYVPSIDLPSAVCITGSRYSTEADHESPFFPADGDVEDMELYALAVLLHTFQIPLIALKFIVNYVPTDGPAQAQRNLVASRSHAEKTLMKVLEEVTVNKS